LNNLQKILNDIKKRNNLKFRVGLGGLILGSGSGIENAARFLRNMVLTRLLAPEAFGIMAIVMAVNAMYEAFTEVGIKESVIQNPRGSENTFLNGAWWFSLIRSGSLYLIAFFIAPFIAHFYKNGNLTLLIRFAFINMLFNGALSAGTYLSLKKLNYKKWTIISSGGNICGIIVAIVLAFLLRNVWALAIGFCAESLFRMVLSYILCPFLPRLVFHKQDLQDLFKFAKGMFGLPLLTFISMRADTFTLGKLYSTSELGLYNMASTLAQMPSLMFSNLLGQILLPAFSTMQNDTKRLSDTYMKTTSMILFLSLPLILFCFFFSKPLLTLVYGFRYAEYSLPFAFIFLAFSIRTCQNPLITVSFAKGLPGLNRFAALIRAFLAVVCIYPVSKYFGFLGASVLILAFWTIPFFIQLYQMRSKVIIDSSKLFNIGKISIFMIISFIIVYLILHKLFVMENLFIQLGLGIFCCIFSYGIFLAANFSYVKGNFYRFFPR
jgi:Membrane protein involved in the export of O-antigen and teichoic acid